MMTTMIKENGITFKELEKNIFKNICRIGQDYTREFLEQYDQILMKERDRARYRHKGYRKTSVKTVYGEVEYRRAVYEETDEDGIRHFVFLLDEALGLDHVGLISENMAEIMVKAVTELSYRQSAEKITEMTGQPISAMGVWNVIQELGEKVCENEKELVEEYRAGHLHGKSEAAVLFEEADGIYISMQGEDRKRSSQGEIKVGIAYDGWRREGPGRYRLNRPVVAAGFERSKEFQEYREAVIADTFNLDETETRILNGDGGSWIRKVKDRSTVFQLDPFHRNKAVRELIHHKKAQRDLMELLEEKDIDGVFHYLTVYHDSLSDEKEIADTEALIRYYSNNRSGLLPYQDQIQDLPEAPDGLEYRNMGTMENHVWSIIARRMKHNHTSWSRRGGNHLAKILAKKCSGRLQEVTEKLQRPAFEEEQEEVLYEKIQTAAKTPCKDGHGYGYPVEGHLASLDTAVRGDGRRMFSIVGF